MLGQLASLRHEHLVLMGFVSFFVMLGGTVLGTVLSVQWRKVRQTEMELWFKHELHSRGVSIDEIDRLLSTGAAGSGKRKPSRPIEQGWAGAPERPIHGVSPVSAERRLVRSSNAAVVGGLCAGIADYMGITRSFFRVAFVFVMLSTGIFPMLIAYFIACAFIPSDADPAPAVA